MNSRAVYILQPTHKTAASIYSELLLVTPQLSYWSQNSSGGHLTYNNTYIDYKDIA